MPVAYDFAVVCADAIFFERDRRITRNEKLMKSDVVKIIREQDALRLDKPTASKRRPKQTTPGPFGDRTSIPPPPNLVTLYSASIGYPMDGEKWCDQYAAKGWSVGKTRMKDWQAAVRNWKTNGWGMGTLTLNGGAGSPNGRGYHEASASLGSLQMQLKRIEDEMEGILYPGGAAFKTIPTGDKLARFNTLKAQREGIKSRIDAFGNQGERSA